MLMLKINNLPIVPFIVIMVAVIAVSVYGFFREQKKKPGDPMNAFTLVAILGEVAVIFYRCVAEFPALAFAQKLALPLLYSSFVLCGVGFWLCIYFSHKKGYMSDYNYKGLKRCAIMLIALIAMTAVMLTISRFL